MLTIIESVLGKFSTRASSSIVESALYVSFRSVLITRALTLYYRLPIIAPRHAR